MLRACALKHGGTWDKSLPYVEFAYNNSYQSSLKMAHLRHYMEESAEHHCFGIRQGKVNSSVQRL
jgi:hypothetical protein